ncbi:MAG: hypothetical protein M3530_02930 [Thermoproteota archaeon]|nr:hypothetical protein [Thermoproteota archaeon]
MTIVRLKTLERDHKVKELLNMFMLPCVDHTNYQPKPRPELTGGSAIHVREVYRIKAVSGLLRWTRKSVS